jgi:hypothetical protein
MSGQMGIFFFQPAEYPVLSGGSIIALLHAVGRGDKEAYKIAVDDSAGEREWGLGRQKLHLL